MGQGEIIEFLKTCKEPVTRKQIAEAIEFTPQRVSTLLRALLKYHEVGFIEYPQNEATLKAGYILMRRTRFFFVIE